METLIPIIQDAFSKPELVISILVFTTVVLLVLGGAFILSGGNPVQRRLQTRVGKGALASAVTGGSGTLRKLAGGAKGSELLRKLGKSTSGKGEEKGSRIRQRLIQAGYAGPAAVSVYFLSRIALAFILPFLALVVTPIVAGSLPPEKLFLIGMTAVILGFFLPVVFIAKVISTRQRDAREGFPDALDMLLVCVEAGLSLAAALNRVGAEIGRARPMLGAHFKQVAQEMQAGNSREQALRNLADRIGIDEVRSLVTLLLQSDALGTSIAQSLRVHAEEMRKTRLLRAEERANKLPAKMAIPLVLFILPCLMSVIMTPVIIRIYRAIGPVMGGG